MTGSYVLAHESNAGTWWRARWELANGTIVVGPSRETYEEARGDLPAKDR
jgi:hypothetical protein